MNDEIASHVENSKFLKSRTHFELLRFTKTGPNVITTTDFWKLSYFKIYIQNTPRLRANFIDPV